MDSGTVIVKPMETDSVIMMAIDLGIDSVTEMGLNSVIVTD